MASKQNWDHLNKVLAEAAARRDAGINLTGGGSGSTGNPYRPTPGLQPRIWNADDPTRGMPDIPQIPDQPGWFDRIIDVISRPVYATANVVKDWIDQDPNTDNPLESIGAGLSGIDKTLWSDVLKESNQEGFTNFSEGAIGGLGLVGDIVLDPLNLLPGIGFGKQIAKGGQKVLGAVTGGKYADKGLEGAKAVAAATPEEAVARAEAARSDLTRIQKEKAAYEAGQARQQDLTSRVAAGENLATKQKGLFPNKKAGPNTPLQGMVRSEMRTPEDVGAALSDTGQGSLFDIQRDLSGTPRIVDQLPPEVVPSPVATATRPPIGQQTLPGMSKADMAFNARGKEVQQGLFPPGKAGPRVPAEPGVPVPKEPKATGRGLFSLQEAKDLGKIRPSVEGELTGARSLSEAQAARISQAQDGARISDAVGEEVGSKAGVIKSADETAIPRVTAPNTTGSPVADAVAKAGGNEPAQVTEKMIQHEAAAKAGPAPMDPAAGSTATANALDDAARAVTGQEPLEVFQNARTVHDPVRMGVREQYNYAAQATTAAHKSGVKAGLKGEALTEHKMAAARDLVGQHKAMAVVKGMYPESALRDGFSVRMHISDLWNSVSDKVLRAMQFGPKSIPISSQMAGMTKAMQAMHLGMSDGQAIAEIAKTIANKSYHGTRQVMTPGSARVQEAARGIWEAKDNIAAKWAENEAAFKTRDAVIGKRVGEDVADKVIRDLDNPNKGVGDRASQINGMNNDIKTQVRQMGGGPGAEAVATAAAGKRVAGKIDPEELASSKLIDQTSKNRAKRNKPGTSQSAKRDFDKELKEAQKKYDKAMFARDTARAKAAGSTPDEILGQVSESFFGKMMTGLGTMFQGGYGMGKLFPFARQEFNTFNQLYSRYTRQLDKILKAHSPDNIKKAAALLAPGRNIENLDPAVKAAYEDLLKASENTIPLSKGVASYGDTVATRSGMPFDMVNQFYRKGGVDFEFKPAKVGDNIEIPEQLRLALAEADDPIKLLSSLFNSHANIAANQSVGKYFSHLHGSTEAKPGHVRIRPTGQADITAFIDTSLHYPREAAEMMGRYMRNVASQEKAMNKLMTEWYSPYLSMLKTSQTIIRPAHHARNYMGDTYLTVMSGRSMNDIPRAGYRATRLQASLGDDSFRAINDMFNGKPPMPGDRAITVKMKNGDTGLSNKEIAYWAGRTGMIVDWKRAEDVFEAGKTAGGLNKVNKAVQNNRFIKFMGKVSETTSQNTRYTHLFALLSDPKFTKQFAKGQEEEMFRAATAQISKWHPDTSGLSAFENKYMRNLFPYYSFFKQTTPLIGLTLATKPAVLSLPSKTVYGLQTALGMDPQSLTNPFPVDSMYPSFLRNSITGPLSFDDNTGGGLVNLGSVPEGLADVFNTPSGNPLPGLAAMLTPAISTPWGLTTDHHPLDSSHYISDKSEWIDKALPFMNQIANLSGYSPAGSIESLGATGELDPQRSVIKNEKEDFGNRLLRLFNPVGWQESERPSFYNIARGENQGYQEENDPLLYLKKRIEEGRMGLPNVATGRLSE